MFFTNYAPARKAFLQAAKEAKAALSHDIHPLKGVQDEELALDIAVLGDPNAERLLMMTSACHGVEGYCGSGTQIALLKNKEFLQAAANANVTVILAHALNPFGFSYWRRVTEDNVDLNRNFLDFSQPLPENPRYAEFHHLMLPKVWPPTSEIQAEVKNVLQSKGMPYLQAAVTSGQHTHPDGLHYSGVKPTWSNLAVRRLMKAHCSKAKRLGWIDMHTGLGPSGHGERIFSPCYGDGASAAAKASSKRATAWWGGEGRTPVTSFEDGTSSSAKLSGTMGVVTLQECPQLEVTKIAMEYGTQPILQVMEALRGEQWLQMHPDAPIELAADLKRKMLDAFYTHTPEWHAQIVAQGTEAMFQAVEGLS